MSEELLAAIHTELLEQRGMISSLITDVKSVIGDGKPGRMDKVEEDVEELKGVKNRFYGFLAAFGGIEGLYHYIVHKFHL
jgi:hypothetical protein